MARTKIDRVYAPLDDEVARALEVSAELGLVEAGASRAQRLRALALYAADTLTAEAARTERIAAYRELAEDEERLQSIREGNALAASHGLL